MKLAVLSLAAAVLLAPCTASVAEAAPPATRSQVARPRAGGPANFARPQGRRFDRRWADGRRQGPWRGYYGYGRYRYRSAYYGGFYPGFYPYGYYPYYGGVSIGYSTPVYDDAPYPYFRPATRVYEGKIVPETAPGRITR